MLSAAREPDRHREGEYHVRTDSLAESALMGGAVILMTGEREEGRVYLAHHHVVAVCQAQAGIWKPPLDSSQQDALGCCGPPANPEVPVKLFFCHWVTHEIELPPPGNLSDWAPHIFISARGEDTHFPSYARIWKCWQAGSLGRKI